LDAGLGRGGGPAEATGAADSDLVRDVTERLLDQLVDEAESLIEQRAVLGVEKAEALGFRSVPEDQERWDLVVPDWLAPTARGAVRLPARAGEQRRRGRRRAARRHGRSWWSFSEGCNCSPSGPAETARTVGRGSCRPFRIAGPADFAPRPDPRPLVRSSAQDARRAPQGLPRLTELCILRVRGRARGVPRFLGGIEHGRHS
jgi:hypothetical protein